MAYTTTGSPLGLRHVSITLLTLLLATWSSALDISYCSPDNNAGNYQVFNYNYMSNGKCHDHCVGSYVFAIIQGTNCWCSNQVPTDQVNTLSCNQACPGYPYEWCGSTSAGLFAYFNIGGTPTGTSGGSSSVAVTSSSSPSNVAGSSTSSVVSTTSVSTSSSASSSSPSTTQQSPSVFTSIISVTGRVSTIIITPTPSPQSTADSALGATATPSSSSRGLSAGAVAGIVIGVAIVIGALIGGIVFFVLRKRHRKNIDAISDRVGSPAHTNKSGNNRVPSRQVSQMSSAGLLTRIPRSNTVGAMSTEDPRSVAGGSTADRSSTHMTVDQRLNPWAIYSNEDSRNSNVSLNDAHDYSRQLRVANPDP